MLSEIVGASWELFEERVISIRLREDARSCFRCNFLKQTNDTAGLRLFQPDATLSSLVFAVVSIRPSRVD